MLIGILGRLVVIPFEFMRKVRILRSQVNVLLTYSAQAAVAKPGRFGLPADDLL
jgi:hypothetical protein